MIHRVSIESSGESYACAEDVHLLEAMEMARCHGIPVGCRNGGCGACKVLVASGSYQTRKMNRAVVSAAEEAEGRVLACKTYPRSDIVVQVLGRVWQTARVSPRMSPGAGFNWTTSNSRPDKET